MEDWKLTPVELPLEGWKLVPIKPTDTMVHAAQKVAEVSAIDIDAIYAAMIKAAQDGGT